MRIKVKDIITNEIGTIEEEDFNPLRYQRVGETAPYGEVSTEPETRAVSETPSSLGISPFTYYAAKLQASPILPTMGSMLSAAVPIPGVRGAVGGGIYQYLSNLLQRGGTQAFVPTREEVGRIGGMAGTGALTDIGVTAALATLARTPKLLSWLFSPLTKTKSLVYRKWITPTVASKEVEVPLEGLARRVKELIHGSIGPSQPAEEVAGESFARIMQRLGMKAPAGKIAGKITGPQMLKIRGAISKTAYGSDSLRKQVDRLIGRAITETLHTKYPKMVRPDQIYHVISKVQNWIQWPFRGYITYRILNQLSKLLRR